MKRGGPSAPVPPDIDWYVWRIVRARYATLDQLRTTWTLCDLSDAHAVLDLDDQLNATPPD